MRQQAACSFLFTCEQANKRLGLLSNQHGVAQTYVVMVPPRAHVSASVSPHPFASLLTHRPGNARTVLDKQWVAKVERFHGQAREVGLEE